MSSIELDRPSHAGTAKRGLYLILVGLAGVVNVASGASSPPAVTRVVIQSYWAGYSPYSPLKTDLLIERQGHGFQLTGTLDRKHFGKAEPVERLPAREVSVAEVAALVRALQAPPRRQLDPSTLGVTLGHIQRNIDQAWEQGQTSQLPSAIRTEADAYRHSLQQPGPLAAMLTRGFAARHSDDYPYVAITIELADGSKLTACSDSQQYLMLPWRNGLGQSTYAPDIAHALWALLPGKATNRSRLHGRIQDYELDAMLGEGLGEPVGHLRAEAVAGPALQALESHFKVSNVAPMEMVEGKGPFLDADLRLPDSPANLTLSTRLPLHDGALVAPNHDIQRIETALSLVQATPALSARMKASPSVQFHMNDRFGWAWLDSRTAKQFVQQMRAMRKLPELETDPQLMRGAAMVTEGKAPIYWIVLPDHRAVLWKRFSHAAPAPGAMRCASVPMGDTDEDDAYLQDLCEGTIFGSDGQLARPDTQPKR